MRRARRKRKVSTPVLNHVASMVYPCLVVAAIHLLLLSFDIDSSMEEKDDED